MDQEKREFPRKGMAMLFGLASSGLDRDDDIAQELQLRRWGVVVLRKRENIGGIIMVQIRPIEPPHRSITHEEH